VHDHAEMGSDATLRDVAEKAGVSLGTASLALNNRPSVAPETRARVVEAAASLGYSTRPPNRAFSKELRSIGMLVKHDLGLKDTVNAFYSHVQLGVASECGKLGLTLMYANVEVDPYNRPVMLPSAIDRAELDGLLLVGAQMDTSIRRLAQQGGFPIVMVDGSSPENDFDCVLNDDHGGAYAAIRYLINAGHRDIALIGSTDRSYISVLERRRGYFDALKAAGIDRAYAEDSALGRASAYEATQRVLTRNPQVSAIFTCNDEGALGVMDAIHDMGLSVPHDVCLVGFDDIDIARELRPALTTVRSHKSWLGACGVQLLLQRAADPDRPTMRQLLSTRLIERDSVCAYSQQRQRGGGLNS
jgi:LacI family transcriptional regulator